MKKSIKAQQEAMEKAAEQDDISVMSDDQNEDMTCLDKFVHHCQNSSLLIFPQNSTIRQWAQLCVQSEDDDEEQMKNRQSAQEKLAGAGGDGAVR